MGGYQWTEAVVFLILHVLVFYPTRHRLYRALILAATLYVSARLYLSEVPNPPKLLHALGSMIALHFTFTTYLLCAEGTFPDHWRRVRDQVRGGADPGGLDNLPSNFPFSKKLWWMLEITHSPRMVGWIQEPRDNLPPHPPPSRPTFLWKTSIKFIIYAFLVPDLVSLILGQTPAFDSRLHDPTDGPEAYLAAVPLLRRVPYVLAYGRIAQATISTPYNLFALLCVGFGLSSPTLWPDMWGRWGDAYTVRKLWGYVVQYFGIFPQKITRRDRKTWHQIMRPMFTGVGRLVANKVFRFPRGTNRSSYTQLYVAFFLSGAIHVSGQFVFEKRLSFPTLNFFLLQAVAITFEDFVIYITKRFLRPRGIELNPGKADESWVETVLRVMGYCWVTLWFCWSLPIWIDELSSTGFNDRDRGPIASVILDASKRWT